MKNILILALTFFSIKSYSQTNELLIKQFVDSAVNEKNSLKNLKEKFLYSDDTIQVFKDDSLFVEYLKEIKKTVSNCSKIDVISFKTAKKQNISGFFSIENKNKKEYKNTYFIKCDEKIVIPVLMKSGKIMSLSAIKKGKYNFFLIL